MSIELDALDAADPLRDIPDRFEPGRAGTLYFDANSIGAMPKAAAGQIARITREWRELRRSAWGASDWLDAPKRLGDKLAPVIGARAGEVVVGDSTSVNLFKALGVALRLRPGRTRIITEIASFPTDLYVAQSVVRLFPGTEIVYAPEGSDVRALIDDRAAVVYLSHVDYRSGARLDLPRITAHAHAQGAVALWDLSHSAGANRIDLAAADVDLAVGCGYKYLCGGPGAPGYMAVHSRLQAACEPLLAGWMGHADKFAFDPEYRPAAGTARHIVGTPAVYGNAIFEAALDVWGALPLQAAFEKHARLTSLLLEAIESALGEHGVAIVSPRDPQRRGGFVSVRHAAAKAIVAALDDHDVVASYRPPDVIRFGVSPLYHRYRDVGALMERLAAVVIERRWDQPKYRNAKST